MTCEYCKNSTSTFCYNCYNRTPENNINNWIDLEEWAKSQKDFYLAIRHGQFMIKERGKNGCRIHADSILEALRMYKNFKLVPKAISKK